MVPEEEPLDVLTIGEMVVDFIWVEKTDTLSNASTFRRYLGGSPANIAELGGTSAVIGAFRKAREMGKIVTLDPNYDPRVWPDKVEAWEVLAEVMPYVTIVKPSLEDARHLFDVNMDEETLEETPISEFHDLGAKIVILTRSGGVVTVSDNGNLMAHLDGKDWPEAVRFAHQVASLILRVEGHLERMIDRESLYAGLKSAGQRTL